MGPLSLAIQVEPMGHGVQLEVPPKEYWPVLQSVGVSVPAPQDFPAGQSRQVTDPALLYFPAKHVYNKKFIHFNFFLFCIYNIL